MESVGFRSAAATAAVVLVVGAASFQLMATPVVAEVRSGDSIVVTQGFREYEVRLANVDTPDLAAGSNVPQCLGDEARRYLKEQLPVGTAVTVDLNSAPRDAHGRVVAGVYRDGVLVNAEIARAGFAIPVAHGSDVRFFDIVESGARDAQAAKVGLFDPSVTCTLAAEIRAAKLPERFVRPATHEYQRDDVLEMSTQVRELIRSWEALGQAKGNRNLVLRSAWSEGYVSELKQEYWESCVLPAKMKLADVAATVPGADVAPELISDVPIEAGGSPQPPASAAPGPGTSEPTARPKTPARPGKPGRPHKPHRPVRPSPTPAPSAPTPPTPAPEPLTPTPEATTPEPSTPTPSPSTVVPNPSPPPGTPGPEEPSISPPSQPRPDPGGDSSGMGPHHQRRDKPIPGDGQGPGQGQSKKRG